MIYINFYIYIYIYIYIYKFVTPHNNKFNNKIIFFKLHFFDGPFLKIKKKFQRGPKNKIDAKTAKII